MENTLANKGRLRAVIFDFDGTLARPALDFTLMKRRIADLAGRFLSGRVEPGPLPALEWIESLAESMGADASRDFRSRSQAVIENMESEAAARTSLFDFTRPTLERLRRLGAAPAVITRNSRRSLTTVFPDAERYLALVLAREDVPDVKPDPGHLLAALAALGATPGQAMMVGDHPLDVLTARRAGTYAAAVASGGTPLPELERATPDLLARDVGELMALLERDGWV
jgi:phosphoglycolate phosphatase